MELSREERETIITRTQAQHDWHVFTEDSRVIRKLTRLHGPGTPVGSSGMEWTLPRSCVSFRSKPRRLTEAERARSAEALRLAREAKRSEAL